MKNNINYNNCMKRKCEQCNKYIKCFEYKKKKEGEKMANEQNLIPITKRTPREQREISSKGGKASAEAKRKRKTMKEQTELLLSLPLRDNKVKERLKGLGFETEDIDNQMATLMIQLDKALNGDIKSLELLRDLIGEKPQENIKVEGNVNPLLESINRQLVGGKDV